MSVSQIAKAEEKVRDLFRGELRRDGVTPLAEHSLFVGRKIKEWTNDENLIVAGILHDTIEDTSYTFNELENDFGSRVRELVAYMTEINHSNNSATSSWEERKQDFLNRLAAFPEEILILSAADKIHNLLSLTEEIKKEGDAIWQRYHSPRERQFWYLGECHRIFNDRLPPGSPALNDLNLAYANFLKICNM